MGGGASESAESIRECVTATTCASVLDTGDSTASCTSLRARDFCDVFPLKEPSAADTSRAGMGCTTLASPSTPGLLIGEEGLVRSVSSSP